MSNNRYLQLQVASFVVFGELNFTYMEMSGRKPKMKADNCLDNHNGSILLCMCQITKVQEPSTQLNNVFISNMIIDRFTLHFWAYCHQVYYGYTRVSQMKTVKLR
jgi:hypothetical protein